MVITDFPAWGWPQGYCSSWCGTVASVSKRGTLVLTDGTESGTTMTETGLGRSPESVVSVQVCEAGVLVSTSPDSYVQNTHQHLVRDARVVRSIHGHHVRLTRSGRAIVGILGGWAVVAATVRSKRCSGHHRARCPEPDGWAWRFVGRDATDRIAVASCPDGRGLWARMVSVGARRPKMRLLAHDGEGAGTERSGWRPPPNLRHASLAGAGPADQRKGSRPSRTARK